MIVWLQDVFLHTIKKQLGFEIKNTVSFTSAPKAEKYLGVNLTKNYVIAM